MHSPKFRIRKPPAFCMVKVHVCHIMSLFSVNESLRKIKLGEPGTSMDTGRQTYRRQGKKNDNYLPFNISHMSERSFFLFFSHCDNSAGSAGRNSMLRLIASMPVIRLSSKTQRFRIKYVSSNSQSLTSVFSHKVCTKHCPDVHLSLKVQRLRAHQVLTK